LVDEAITTLDGQFAEIYSQIGRTSIPPEQLLRAMLLQAFYSVRSERQLMERLDFDLLFRWFVGLGIDDPVWDASTFSKNRDWLLGGNVVAAFLSAVLAIPCVKRLLSHDHFTADGTLIQVWASMKSLKPKDIVPSDPSDPPAGGRNPDVEFRGRTLFNDTHQNSTDPQARLYCKGQGKKAKLCFMGHALMENRNGLIVDGCVTQATGQAERIAALAMIEKRANRPTRITLGTDKGYDAADFVNELRAMAVTPHVACYTAGPAPPSTDAPHAIPATR
jgi:transposase